MIVLVYLLAIVAANLSVAWLGPNWSIVNAFLFIGLDLTLRDHLHLRWEHRNLKVKMALLIMAGGMLSYLLNRDAAAIAFASSAAFSLAAIADTITYLALRSRAAAVRMNGSNVVGAAVDSLVFPTLAFGAILVNVTAGQFLAKVFGGAIWSAIIIYLRDRQTSKAMT